jgi:hypothetical protein
MVRKNREAGVWISLEPNLSPPAPTLAIRTRWRETTDMTLAQMTGPAAMATVPTRPRHLGLRIVLAIIAIIEALDALSNVSILFGDMSQIPGPGLGGLLIKAHIATHLPLALAAVLFAVIGRVRHAIIALGAVVAMTWLNYMPSVVLHGLEFDGGFAALQTTAQIIAFPLMAACAIAFAARDRRLGLATILVSLPTLFNVFGVIAFAIGVSLHGF